MGKGKGGRFGELDALIYCHCNNIIKANQIIQCLFHPIYLFTSGWLVVIFFFKNLTPWNKIILES